MNCVQTVKGHTSRVNCLVYLGNSRLVSGSWDDTIKIWNITTRECIQTLKGHWGSVCSLAYIDDTRLASASGDNTIKIWDMPTKAVPVAEDVVVSSEGGVEQLQRLQ